MWHILRKDAWMMRVAVVATPAQMGLWAWAEVASGGMPWWPVAMLRQLIAFAWCFAACVVTHGEMAAERTPDWSTRPIPRGPLLASKLLFMGAVFHLPYLLACAAILWGKGFLPWHHVGRLLEQQLLCAAMFTIPCLALASVTSSFGKFGAAGLVLLIVAMVATIAGAWQRGLGWLDDPGGIWWLPVLIVACGMAVLLVQYFSRRTGLARVLGMGSVMALIAVYVFTVRDPSGSLVCGHGVAGWKGEVRVDGEGRRVTKAKGKMDRDSYRLPISFPVADASLLMRPQLVDWEMRAGGGQPSQAGFRMRVDEGSYGRGTNLYVEMMPWQRERTESAEARMKVSMRVNVSRALRPVWRRVGAASMVPGLGVCGSYMEDGEQAGRFRVFCESPVRAGRDVAVTVHARERHWRLELSEGWLRERGLRWMTPVLRMETSELRVVERMPEGSWVATRAEVKDASLEFVPEERVGCELVDLVVAGRWDHAAGRFWPVMERK